MARLFRQIRRRSTKESQTYQVCNRFILKPAHSSLWDKGGLRIRRKYKIYYN